MNRAIASWWGAVWRRLFDRSQVVRVSEQAPAVPAPSPEPVPAPAATAIDEAPKGHVVVMRDDTDKSLRETLGLSTVTFLRPSGTNVRSRTQTLEALKDLKQIPALQSLAQGFTKALGRPEVAVEDVVTSISKDSALCVRMLRMANSVLVSSERRIEDLDTAVQMLGVSRVRNAAQALFTLRDANRVAEGFDWRHLWMHSLATAAIAEELEPQLRSVGDSQIYLAALLHDVGKIVLSTLFPEIYRDILIVAWNDGGPLEALERARLGVDHREAGLLFAQANGLPMPVIAAIAHHDRPSHAENFHFEAAVVSLANHISKAHGLGFSGARLDANDQEFAELEAWDVIEEAIGWRPNAEVIELELGRFVLVVRDDLAALRASA